MKITQALTSMTVALSMLASSTPVFAKALAPKGVVVEQGSIKMDGYIYKDNNTSNMQVAIRAIGNDSGLNVGYGVLGNAIVVHKGDAENIKDDVDFTDMEAYKVGETPAAGQSDDYTSASPFDKNISLQGVEHAGKLIVAGKKEATGALNGTRTGAGPAGDWVTLVGTKIKGTYSQKSTGTRRELWGVGAGSNSNAIQLTGLEVNGAGSAGQLNYVYGKDDKKDPSKYHSSKDARFGTYAIQSSIPVDNSPVIVYNPGANNFEFFMDFGGFLVTGTIMFVDNTPLPKLDKNSFFNFTQPLAIQTGASGGSGEKAATTVGIFNITVKRKGGGSIVISKNLAKDSTAKDTTDEVQTRALISFILGTAYDTFGN